MSRLSIVVDLGSSRRAIEFEWCVVSDGGRNGCKFSTDDELLQKAIESHKYFHQGYIWTDDKPLAKGVGKRKKQ